MLATVISDTYKWMLAFHILFAVTWVGGNIFLQFLTSRASKAGSNAELAWLSAQAEWWGTRVLIPTSLLLVALGFGLLNESDGAWKLSQFWVSFGFGVWFLSFIAGAGFLGPETGRINKLLEERGFDDPEYQRRLARIFLVSRIELGLLILAVLDMAVKPFL